MKELFEEHWACLTCGQCKWFKIDADIAESTCKRLDHKHLKLAQPYFKSYDCGQSCKVVCSDFEPAAWCKWLVDNWEGFDDYFKGEEFNGELPLVVDGNTSVRYKIKKHDFIYGTFIDDNGKLKWVEKEYYKRAANSPIGYVLIHELNS